jgi:hypothetical protein
MLFLGFNGLISESKSHVKQGQSFKVIRPVVSICNRQNYCFLLFLNSQTANGYTRGSNGSRHPHIQSAFTFFMNALLGALAKLRNATITFIMSVRASVCPSVRMEQLDSHWTNFYKI